MNVPFKYSMYGFRVIRFCRRGRVGRVSKSGGKIQKWDSQQQQPKFCEFALPKFDTTASWNSGKQFFVKFCFNWNDLLDFLKIAWILEAVGVGCPIFEFSKELFPYIDSLSRSWNTTYLLLFILNLWDSQSP